MFLFISALHVTELVQLQRFLKRKKKKRREKLINLVISVNHLACVLRENCRKPNFHSMKEEENKSRKIFTWGFRIVRFGAEFKFFYFLNLIYFLYCTSLSIPSRVPGSTPRFPLQCKNIFVYLLLLLWLRNNLEKFWCCSWSFSSWATGRNNPLHVEEARKWM